MAAFIRNHDGADVEAVQWSGHNIERPVPVWIAEAIIKDPGETGCIFRLGDRLEVFIASDMKAIVEPWDWIVRDSSGRLNVIEDDFFEVLYSPKEPTP
jgi:hypothetical protein